jgi:uncharacterized membrane protein YheB (UPF0754 family)
VPVDRHGEVIAVQHWQVYATMPFVASLIGYVTKRVAIEMMFRPVEFAGIPPVLGWQGVLPANAERMASTATEMLTANLVDPKEIFARLDPAQVAKEIEQPLLRVVEDVTREVMETYQPRLWEVLPSTAQQLLLKRVQAEAPRAITKIMREISDNIEDVLDLKHMVVTNLVRNKALLNRLIRDISQPEMRFIARSGIGFGFALGCIQLLVWAVTKSPIVLPLFGLAIGRLTDWLALKLIFLPREPRRFFGLYTWQGVFQKRRDQVAADYGDMIAREIITAGEPAESRAARAEIRPAVHTDHPRSPEDDRRAGECRQTVRRDRRRHETVPGNETGRRRESGRTRSQDHPARRALCRQRARRALYDRRGGCAG